MGIVNDFIENTQTSIDCTIAGEFDDLGTMAAQQIGDISGSVSDQIIQQTGFSDFLNLQTKLSNVSQTALQFSAAVNATSKAANDFLTNFDNYNKTYPNSISSSDMETVHREIGNFSEYPALISTPINGYLSYSDSFSQQIIQVQRNLNVTSGDVSKYTSTVTGQITSANETVQTSVNDFKSKSEQLRDNIKDAQDNINDNLSDDNLDKWSWSQYTLLVFIVPIAFILLCLAFGLVCGIVGYKASREPYERSSLSGLGGACLMVAVVLAFIFAWILMLITMTFFSVGFLTETLVCKGVFYNSGNDMFNFIEKNWGENINADNFTVNISLLVNTCKSNGTLYNALNVQQVLNLEDIRGTVKNIADNIDINQILKFDTGSVYVANTDQLQELAGYLRNLSNILDKLAFNYPYQTAEILKKINPHNASSQQDVFNTLNQTFIYLVASISTTNSTYKEMQNLLQETANLTDSLRLSRNQTINPSTIIANANQTAIVKVGTAQDELNSFVDDFIRRVEYETAKCAPLYQVYQNVGDILCKQAMNPIQAIWLSLGWCLLFFIPMIVIAVKLEKYFRRMDVQLYADVNQPFTSVSYDKKSSKEPITSITYGWDIPDRIPRAKPHQVGPA